MTMTPEETFQATVRGLAAQGWQQSLRNGRCAYRGENGRKCAVGVHIPDEKHRPEWEPGEASKIGGYGVAWSELPTDVFGDASTADFDKLQWAHDTSATPCEMRLTYAKLGALTGYAWPADVPAEGEIT